MSLPTLLDELLVVIVLYRTRPEESASYQSVLCAQNVSPTPPYILFYDNSPSAAAISGSRIYYVHDPRNSGISKAYNTASARAEKLDKSWLLFLDQDSKLPANFFIELANATRHNPDTKGFVPRVHDRIGLLSPFQYRSSRGRRVKKPPETLQLARYRFINSGLFIRRSTFVSAGGYDEEIPLDFSDISFADRLKHVTDHVGVIDCDVFHDFSDNRDRPIEDALVRFRLYCTGAFKFGIRNGHSCALGLQTIARAARLSYRYRDKRFLMTFFEQLVYD